MYITHIQIWIYRLCGYSLTYMYIYAYTYTPGTVNKYMYLTYLAAIPCQNGPSKPCNWIQLASLHANGLGGRSQATAWWKARCWEGSRRFFPGKWWFFVESDLIQLPKLYGVFFWEWCCMFFFFGFSYFGDAFLDQQHRALLSSSFR